MLSERLQVLVDPRQRARLEAEAARTGRSVGALVRDAIDVAFPSTTDERVAAVAAILDAAPMPVPSVDDLRRELDDLRARRS